MTLNARFILKGA